MGEGSGDWGTGFSLATPGQQHSRGAKARSMPVLALWTVLHPGSSQQQVWLLGRGMQVALCAGLACRNLPTTPISQDRTGGLLEHPHWSSTFPTAK